VATQTDGLACALIPDPDGPGRRAELRRGLGGIPAVLGPTVHWQDAAASFDRAALGHRLIDEGRLRDDELMVADEHLGAIVLVQAHAPIHAIAERRLAPLAKLTSRSADRMEQTLLAWLEHRGHVRSAADALGVHPQTMRYRLGRLRELLGDQLEDPRFELELALRGRLRR
jgi:sugar diacid utilization regulator